VPTEAWPAGSPAEEHREERGGHEGRAGPSRDLSWPTVGLAWPAREKVGPAASKHREEGRNGDSSPEKKKDGNRSIGDGFVQKDIPRRRE